MMRRLAIAASRRASNAAAESLLDDLHAAFQLLQRAGVKRQANEVGAPPAAPPPPPPSHSPLPSLQLRAGNILDLDGRLMQVLKHSHSQTGRQLGNVQLELRDLASRAKRPLRLRPSETVDVVRLEERRFQFLYAEGDTMHCMDPQSFEQVGVDRGVLAPGAAELLAEGADLTLAFHDGAPVSGSLPPQVTLKVVDAAPHIKGETQAPQYKPATLETGAAVSVPPFVVAGDSIIVDTADGSFVKRAS